MPGGDRLARQLHGFADLQRLNVDACTRLHHHRHVQRLGEIAADADVAVVGEDHAHALAESADHVRADGVGAGEA